jgi:predicted O-methyltransferase YrrM
MPPTTLPSAPDTLSSLRAARERIYSSGQITGLDGSTKPVWPVGLTRERGEAIRDLAIAEHAAAIVETGFAFGMSASFLLEAAFATRANAPDVRPARLVSMDPFQASLWNGAGRRHLRDAGLEAHHRLFEEPSEVVLPRLIAEGEGGRFDLAFIDGDHRFESVFTDVFFARRLLGPGKLIVVDDAWMPAVQKAAAFFESAHLCRREPTPTDSPRSKLILLRVEARGDTRAWDHFADF